MCGTWARHITLTGFLPPTSTSSRPMFLSHRAARRDDELPSDTVTIVAILGPDVLAHISYDEQQGGGFWIRDDHTSAALP